MGCRNDVQLPGSRKMWMPRSAAASKQSMSKRDSCPSRSSMMGFSLLIPPGTHAASSSHSCTQRRTLSGNLKMSNESTALLMFLKNF